MRTKNVIKLRVIGKNLTIGLFLMTMLAVTVACERTPKQTESNTDLIAAVEDKNPTIDPTEYNAFTPSPYSKSQYVPQKTDYDGTEYKNAYKGKKWKVLMIGADQRYMQMENGTVFSTGNHPVETLVPILHLDNAGIDIDVATITGHPVKFEMWAMPSQDEAVKKVFKKHFSKFQNPKKLSDVIANALGEDTPYIGILIPGGHGMMLGIPHSKEVKQVLYWAMENDKYIGALCHGPTALLAASIDEKKEDYIFKGYKMCVFPDVIDKTVQSVGYLPGQMKWHQEELLRELGVEVLNEGADGMCHQDRKLITGDSPYASNKFGKMLAQALLDEIETK